MLPRNRRHRRPLLVVSALLVWASLPACGGAAASADATDGLGFALVAPRLVGSGVMQSRLMVTEAVYFATQQTGAAGYGQVTRAGTVRVTPMGAVYEPTPADRLVVELGGRRHEFTGVEAVGDSSQLFAANWLAAPHRLAYTHALADEAEVRITESFDGGTFVATVEGWTKVAGKRCELRLEARGGTRGVMDLQGSESGTRYTLTGTLTAEGFAVDVKEDHATRFVAAQSLRLLPSQRGSASRTLSTIHSTVRCAGAEFRFDGVQAESGSKEKGGRSDGGVVALAGRILRDGAPFAECRLDSGLPVAVTADGVLPLLDL